MIITLLRILFPSLSLTGTLGYLAWYGESKDALYKVSLLSTLYFVIQLFPQISWIKVNSYPSLDLLAPHAAYFHIVSLVQRSLPTIVNGLLVTSFAFIYQSIPPLVIVYYKYLITAVGPLYILVEAAQSVGLCLLFGERVTNWINSDNVDFYERQDQIRRREVQLGSFSLNILFRNRFEFQSISNSNRLCSEW